MNNEITFINNDNSITNTPEIVEDPILPIKQNNTNDEFIEIPDWDLTPPFDSIDRGDMQ